MCVFWNKITQFYVGFLLCLAFCLLDTFCLRLEACDTIKLSYEAIYGRNFTRLADIGDRGTESENTANRFKFEMDLTDDRYDSRIGLRTIWILSRRDPQGNFFLHNHNPDPICFRWDH